VTEPARGRGGATPRGAGARASLIGLSLDDLARVVGALGEPAYRAKQIFEWIYARRARGFEEMTSLPRSLRERLAERHSLDRPAVKKVEISSDGTKKYLHEMPGASAESVLMPEDRRTTFCLSSQAGCALDCRFCLTATMGFVRHLTPGEIVAQAMAMLEEPEAAGRSPNVVFMGMGEPLHNYDGVMAAFRLLTDPAGLAIPRRKVTLSTAGLVPGIRRLAAETRRPRLAISLNATTDEVRSEIMPINRKYPLAELLEAAAAFPLAPRERLTFEYVMLEGLNASTADAKRLAALVRRHRLRAKVNLIPFNPGGGLGYEAPPRSDIRAFADHLTASAIPCSIRKNRGRDISAACGQLAVGPSAPPGC
jgi:23S rRNA (adenine2503-C2)-methyltransferase